MKNENFIFTGLQPWDIPIGSNAKDIALEMSKNNRVLYVSTPIDLKTRLGRDQAPDNERRRAVISDKSSFLRKINENLWVLDYPFSVLPINQLPDGFIFDFFNKINNRKCCRFIRKIAAELSFTDPILFIDNDIYRSFYAKEFLKPKLTIYYRRDNMVSAFWKKHSPRLEPLICAKSDMVLSNSKELGDAVRKYQSHTYNVGQGVDLSDYSVDKEYKVPQDMLHIRKPIVGYTGMLTSKRLDMDLIFKLAKEFPDISFVLVGQEDSAFSAHQMHKMDNIHFLGMKPSKLMPDYISGFDICMNPQLINDITIGNYPRKIDEYLAMGKPVVATRTQTMALFEDYVHNCDNAEEYISAINEILSSSQTQEDKIRKAGFADSHSWANSVRKIYECINLNK